MMVVEEKRESRGSSAGRTELAIRFFVTSSIRDSPMNSTMAARMRRSQ
jgi:hypothetical protein